MAVAARGLAIAISVLMKIAAAALPVYFIYPLGKRFAESWMGVRAPIDGFGPGLLVAVGVLVAFVASSALAASGTTRACIVRVCRTTALLVAASMAFVLFAWLAQIPTPSHGAEMIAKQMYVKYPPVEAIWPLMGLAQLVGFIVLCTDIALTLGILSMCAPAEPPSRRGSASTAGTSSAAS
jgi:uncharacterized membrane protein (DUF485 family)